MPAGAPPQHSPVWPPWTRPSPIPKRRFLILPKTRKSVGSHRHHVPVFHAVSVPHTGGRPPIHKRPSIRISRPPAIHKKPQSPHLAGHTLQPMPRRSPRASDPHTGHVPTRFHGSPMQPPSSKNPDIGFGETSVSGPANQAPAGLHKFPASTAGAVPHAQAGHRPAETSVSGTANQAPTGLHKLPAAATACSPPAASTHDVALRRGVGVAVEACTQAGMHDGAVGVTPAPRRWGIVHLSFPVSL